MSNDLFSVPSEISSDDYFSARDHVGSLVLFTPTEYKTGLTTSFGDDKDAVATGVVVLDGKENPEFADTLIFTGSLIKVLKPYAKKGHGRVLGRLGRGTAQKGMAAPYILEEPTDADRKVATDYINKNNDPLAL